MKNFNQWMQQVDNKIYNICGLSYMDLADYPYRDYYDDELSPKEVAIMILEDEGLDFE